MSQQLNDTHPALGGGVPFRALLILLPMVFACAVYANLSFAIANPADFRFFPPFEPNVNVNQNGHMGGEYFQMAKALAAGEGFAHPFDRPTGPTAWQPPVYPLLLAGLLWIFNGDRDGVMAVVIFLQVYVLIGTGLLVVALARQTTYRIGAGVVLFVYLGVLLWNFRHCFQFTHDSWLVLLGLDLVIGGSCWLRPLSSWKAAAVWGLLGGLCAMISPVVGFTWGMLTVWSGVRQQSWSLLTLAIACAGLALAPWTIRNYLVFGRIIPIKSNLAFEMYQSQCLQPGGVLTKFIMHPAATSNPEGIQYVSLGETAYLDRKWEQFWQSVAADPRDCADRIASRFLAATLWYVPFSGTRESWVLWLRRLTHPLPFLGLLFLVFTSVWRRLHWAQWTVIGVYLLYLLPYVGISYYNRYATPLLGVKVLLVIWAVDRVLSWRTPAIGPQPH